MDWKQELLKRLDALAAKLGTTAGYLWAVLVRQGIAVGAADAFLAVALGVGALALYYLGAKRLYKANVANGWEEGTAGSYIFSVIGIVVLIGYSVGYAYYAVLELVNPQYYALHEILQTLGK